MSKRMTGWVEVVKVSCVVALGAASLAAMVALAVAGTR